MKFIAIAALALCAATPALAQQGVIADRDRHRHRAGPVRADRQFLQGRRERHAHAHRRGQRAGRHQRPQAAAGGRGSRLRSEEGGARRAEAGAAGQDLRRARLDRHRRPRWRRCRSISTTRSRTCFRSAARARCSSRCAPLKFSFAAPYYDQIRARHQTAGEGQGPEEGLHDLPGRRLRPRGDARRARRV